MDWEVFALIVIGGMIFGYLKKGKEDKVALIKTGLLLGAALAIFIAALVIISGIESTTVFVSSGIAIILSVVFLTFFFVTGTIIGDWLEKNLRPSPKT